MSSLNIIVLAAGNSTRLKSEKTKVLHPICGRPMLDYVLAAAKSLKPKSIALVLGHGRESVVEHLKVQGAHKNFLKLAHQKERRGTAHAAMTGLKALGSISGRVLILSGDVPLIETATLRALLRITGKKALGLVTALLPDPQHYGRILRDETGRIYGIVEEKNANAAQRQINEINAGIYCVQADFLKASLKKIRANAKTKEFYLTDLVSLAIQSDRDVAAHSLSNPHEIMGANTRAELAFLNLYAQDLLVGNHLAHGVGMQDPDGVYVDFGVKIGADSYLGSGVQLLGNTRIGTGCTIEPGCILHDSVLGNGVTVKAYSYLESCQVKARATLGPFARVRPDSVIGEGAKVGNFVELKKTHLGAGAKANHLSYLGDTKVGRGANIGAGTITCNYDGWHKFVTVIGDDAFIGSDTQLIAPVQVGKGAYVASGTTVTKRVPPGALAVSRVPQRNVADWARKKNLRNKKKPRAK